MPKNAESKAVDAYVRAQPDAARPRLTRVRSVVMKTLPGAEERISYGIPAAFVDGRMVCFFAGHRDHLALYPMTPFVVDALGDALRPHLSGRATARFMLDETLPVHLIARIVQARADEVASSTTKRATTKRATKKAATKKAATKKSATKKSATKKSATKKTATKKTATKKTVTKKTATNKTAMTKTSTKKRALSARRRPFRA